MSHQTSSPDSWVSTKNSNDLKFAWTSKNLPLTNPDFFRMSLRVTKPGFTPRMRKPKLNSVNGKSGVTSTEEGKESEKQPPVNVVLFLWSEGNCSKRICSSWSNSQCCFYVEVLKRIRENVWRKRPDQWRNNTWLLHNDNGGHFLCFKWSIRKLTDYPSYVSFFINS